MKCDVLLKIKQKTFGASEIMLSKLARTALNAHKSIPTVSNTRFSSTTSSQNVKEYNADLVLECNNLLGECPLWDDKKQLLSWIDCKKPSFWRFDPITNKSEEYPLPERPGSFTFCEDGSLLFSFEFGPAYFDIDRQRILKRVFTFEPGLLTRPNDGRCDRQGRFIFGGMMDPENYEDRVFISNVYRINPDNSYQTILRNIGTTNSICFSLDGKKMYFADSIHFETSTIDQYDYFDDDRIPSNKQCFVDCVKLNTKIPDGSIIDSNGCLWNSLFLGFKAIKYDMNGNIDTIVNIPEPNATCATFGGKDLDTLYITTANGIFTEEDKQKYPVSGGLYAVKIPGVKGVKEDRFKGSPSATPIL